MPREDIQFNTRDNVTLRGWFYTPQGTVNEKRPCIILAHGFAAVKEMALDQFAEYFSTNLAVCALVYDHRNFGDSDGEPRQDVNHFLQCSDYSDAITYAQMRAEVDKDRIGLWGSSYSGGHVLHVAAVDRRVKAVISQVLVADGWNNFHRLVRPDMVKSMNAAFEQDRHNQAKGQPPRLIPLVTQDPGQLSALPSRDSYEFMTLWEAKSAWKNQVTLLSIEGWRSNFPTANISRISPTPMLMVLAKKDELCPIDIALDAYHRAKEPKELYFLDAPYDGPFFAENAGRQVQFWKKWLC